MMCERWLSVTGFVGLYEVSDHGNVRSLPREVRGPHGSTVTRPGRILKATPNKKGYRTVDLIDAEGHRYSRSVHVLVLTEFVCPRPRGLVGCHGPNGQDDNSLPNLRWDTQANNVRDQLVHGTHASGATLDACGSGHPRTPENVYWKRGCRACDGKNRRRRNGQPTG